MKRLEFTVEEQHDGLCVYHYLRRVKGVSRRTIIKLKHYEDGLTLDGAHIRTIDSLHAGGILTLNMRDEPKQALTTDRRAEIMYEDEDYIVFNKPPDMPTHQSRSHFNHTLGNVFAALCEERGISLTYRPLNRLDAGTSGLVVVAKHPHAAAALGADIGKTYTALAQGILNADAGEITAPIARLVPEQPRRGVRDDGQYASTRYRVTRRFASHTLLDLELETGRTHQIRVHLSYIGHPLAGDAMYGGNMDIIARQALHCGHVRFRNPLTGREVSVAAAPPGDFTTAVRKAALEEGQQKIGENIADS